MRVVAGRAGFTLIEMMVVICILAIILVTGVPLTVDWVHSAQTREARNKLEQAYGIAKAIAARNPCAIEGSAAAVALQLTATKVTVVLPGNSSSCDFLRGNPNPQWSATLPAGITLTSGGVPASQSVPVELELSNRGSPTGGDTEFRITKGSPANEEKGTLL